MLAYDSSTYSILFFVSIVIYFVYGLVGFSTKRRNETLFSIASGMLAIFWLLVLFSKGG